MIIDFHTHIFPSFFRNNRENFFAEEPSFELLYKSPKSKLAGMGELINVMDEEKIHKSVIFGFPWKKANNFRRHNDYIIESVQMEPDRLIGFCCFDPLSKEAPNEAERCLRQGLSGVGELAIYDSGFSREIIAAMGEIMAICRKYDVPLLIHTNEPVGHQYPGKQPLLLGQIYDFINTYLSNRIVLAHWGGGLFFYALMKKEVRELLTNVWFDTAASPFLYSPDIYSVSEAILGSEKIIFGSDFPLIRPGRYFNEMKRNGLSTQVIQDITGINAARLLGLRVDSLDPV